MAEIFKVKTGIDPELMKNLFILFISFIYSFSLYLTVDINKKIQN